MIRFDNWENALTQEIERHILLPTKYGVSDCYKLPDDCVFAMTGEHINDAALVGYKTPAAAAKLMRKNGFDTVADVFRNRFEEIPPLLAQRGDIGAVENNGEICGGVFTALGFAARDETQILFLPVTAVKFAFKVAR